MFRKLANSFQIAYSVITVMKCLVMNYLIFHKYSSYEEAFQVNSVDINPYRTNVENRVSS